MSKFKYSFILLSIFLLVTHQLFSQVYKYKFFNQDNRLNNNFINGIIQDNYGNLWIATSEDLSFYNGQKIVNYSTKDGLSDNFITTAYKDSYGILWFGHQNGNITIYNDNKFHILKTGLNNMITGIVEDSLGNIWVSSQSAGILRVRDYEMHHFEVPKEFNISTIGFLQDSIVLAGTMNGLFAWDLDRKDSLVNLREINGFHGFNITGITHSPDGKCVWVTTSDNGIFYLPVDEKSINPQKIIIENGKIKNVQNLFEGAGRSLWISTFGSGLFKLLPEEKDNCYLISVQYNQTNGLPNDYIKTAFRDKEKNLWIGTYGYGLCQQLQDAFLFFPFKADSLPNNITGLYTVNNILWIGTEIGLMKMDITTGKIIDTDFSLKDKVTVICKKNNRILLVGTEDNGLFSYNITKKLFKKIPLEDNKLSNSINTVIQRNDTLWVGTNNGIYKYADGYLKHFSTVDGLGHNVVNDLLYDSVKNIIFVACLSNSLAYVKNDSVLHYPITENNDLFDLVSLTKDINDSLWIATESSGIIWFHEAGSIIFTSENGMKSDYCHGLICDNNNDLLVGHQNGISKMVREKRKFRTYGKSEGLFNSINTNAIVKDSLGNIWFGTTEGLIKYIPKNDFEAYPPDPKLVSILINGNPYKKNRFIKLPYGHYKIEFYFQGISLRSPDKIKFRYMLEENENNYTETKDGKIIYNNLSTGQYTLKVFCGINDEWNEVPETVIISIAKPIWAQWWFILSAILIIAFGVFLFIRIRFARLQKQKIILERKLQIRTREIVEKNKELKIKNQDIIDSLNYAKSLQSSIFPSLDFIKSYFPESFIFFRPKDIVSGDFYRFDKFPGQEKFLITGADCTGHGVPAALMSMIGNILIKDIIVNSENSLPGDILSKLDEAVSKTLRQNQGEKREDGMDVVLCEVDMERKKIIFSSAMRPIVLMRNGKLIWQQGSRFSVGGQKITKKIFKNEVFDMQENDIVYLFSDGFIDQFGGQRGKKFKSSRFKLLLQEIYQLPMHEQKKILIQTFDNWIKKPETINKTYDQIDDVLVMGFRITFPSR